MQDFIPCDIHQDIPAINMTVDESGCVTFECCGCLSNTRVHTQVPQQVPPQVPTLVGPAPQDLPS